MSSSPRSTRREFLQGKSAADVLAGLADRVADALPEPTAENYLMRVARRAMACEFEFLFNAGQYPQAGEAAVAALDLVDQLEDQLTVYRENSEISLLNWFAVERPLIVEPRLFDLLRLAVATPPANRRRIRHHRRSLSRAWGFMRRAGRNSAEDALAEARACVGSEYLELDLRRRACSSPAGVEINLGSIGKGYALDRCRRTVGRCRHRCTSCCMAATRACSPEARRRRCRPTKVGWWACAIRATQNVAQGNCVW